MPPFNGYVSVGLIHSGLLDSHQYLPYVLLLAAQVITIAALARATWLAFLRPRRDDYEREEPLRPGMRASLSTLAACCVLFGVLPRFVLDHITAPSASGLLHSGQYAAGVLNGTGHLPQLHVAFTYTDPAELLITVLSVAVGVLAVPQLLRRREPKVLRVLQAAHNGSVNDYAAYAVGGSVLLTAALSWF